jgi:cell division protein FtsL
MKEKEDKDFVDSKAEQADKIELKKSSIKEYINGSFVAKQLFGKQLRFVVFCTILMVIYIANKFHAEYTLRNNVRLQDEVNELRAESIATAAELMYLSRQSQVFRMVQEQGLELKESRVPPKMIK